MFMCVWISVCIFTLYICKCVYLYAYRNDTYVYVAAYRFVSRCNNLHTNTLVDILYIFHTGMCSHLFVFVCRYLVLYLHVNFLLDVCILNSGSISVSIYVYLHLNADLGRGRKPLAEATSFPGVTTFMHVLCMILCILVWNRYGSMHVCLFIFMCML